MNILCHVGPWCVDQFRTIAAGFDPGATIRIFSCFRKLDETGLVDAYYKYLDTEKEQFISDPRDNEVIKRCRLLRALPYQKSNLHVFAMRLAVREMLLRERPDVVICESTDQYLHDLLFQESRSLNIPSYGLIRSFVNNHFRISTRGELQKVRIPQEDEVTEILHKLTDEQYIPQNLVELKRSLALTYFRIYLSNHARLIYFSALRFFSGELYNYHYWSSIQTVKNEYLHIIPRISLGDLNWKRKIAESNRLVIFIPLQHFPEATVDYWSENIEMIEYLKRLIELINELGKEFSILIKEHPGVWGFRKPSFYRAIEKTSSSVIICPTEVAAQECIAAADAVLVWTGSVGFEAALRGKPVLTTCSPYYASGARYKQISIKTGNNEVRDFIQQVKATRISIDEQRAMISHLLKGLLPGNFKNNGTFDSLNFDDIAEAKRLGEKLREVHDFRYLSL